MDCPPLNLEVNSLEEILRDGMMEVVNWISNLVIAFSEIIDKIFNIPLAENEVVNSAVTSAGVSLTTLFLCMEMFSQMTSKWFERMEDAIQLGIKLVVAKIIIENSSSIVGGISGYFKKLGTASLQDGFNSLASNIAATTTPDIDGGVFGLNYLLPTVLLYFVLAAVFIMMVMLTVEVAGIVFEIGIHMAVGPIALSTLCNSTFRSTGLSYIKSLSAVCLQTTVIGAICKVYTKLGTWFNRNMGGALLDAAGVLGLIVGYFGPLLGLAILCVTIKKSSDITKRMFGA